MASYSNFTQGLHRVKRGADVSTAIIESRYHLFEHAPVVKARGVACGFQGLTFRCD